MRRQIEIGIDGWRGSNFGCHKIPSTETEPSLVMPHCFRTICVPSKSMQADPMKIFDCVCPSCGSSYLVAESTSAVTGPSHADCVICGKRLASWQDPRLKVFRLEMSTQ